MPEAQAILPFEEGTRRRSIELNSIPFVDAQPQTLRLPNVGYLSEIKLKVYLRFDTSKSLNFVGDGLNQAARAILRRVVLSTNMQANIVACSAHGLNLLSLALSPYGYRSSELKDEKTDKPTKSGTHEIWFETIVPVALNQSTNYTLGLINLQNDDVSADLRLEWSGLSEVFEDAATSITNVIGYAVPELTYYDVPDLATYAQPPLNYIVTTQEDVDAINIGSGEHVYPLPRGNVLAQAIHEITENGLNVDYESPIKPNGALATYELRMQNGVTDFKAHAYAMAHEARRRYGLDIGEGRVYNDALYDVAAVGQFDLGYQLLLICA